VIYDKINQRYRRAFGVIFCGVVLIAAAYHGSADRLGGIGKSAWKRFEPGLPEWYD
jgi:hypothetical protein